MRLVIAECTVDYVGRLNAHLPHAPRLLLVKADGSVSVHADDRAYKPLNWMTPPCTLTEKDILDESGEDTGEKLWVVENKKGEQLRITIGKVLADSTYELGRGPWPGEGRGRSASTGTPCRSVHNVWRGLHPD